MTSGLARSVQTRLVRHAQALGVDPNLVLARYATERLLYRLSCSPYAERFVLKGALMLLVWLGEAIRPTRDADLLGFGRLDVDSLRAAITADETAAAGGPSLPSGPPSSPRRPCRASPSLAMPCQAKPSHEDQNLSGTSGALPPPSLPSSGSARNLGIETDIRSIEGDILRMLREATRVG